MRANGVRSLDVSCWNCHHRAIMSADLWPDHVPEPTIGPRMVCTRCGIIGVDAQPNVSLLQCNTPLPRCAAPPLRVVNDRTLPKPPDLENDPHDKTRTAIYSTSRGWGDCL